MFVTGAGDDVQSFFERHSGISVIVMYKTAAMGELLIM